MRHQVWIAQLRTLSIEIESETSADAERIARRAIVNGAHDDQWLNCGTELSVAQLGQPEPPTSQHRNLLAVPDAAQFLGISRTTLYGLMQTGELPSVRIGRRRFIARTQLDQYLSSQTGPG